MSFWPSSKSHTSDPNGGGQSGCKGWVSDNSSNDSWSNGQLVQCDNWSNNKIFKLTIETKASIGKCENKIK